jgi:hypothetical protein
MCSASTSARNVKKLIAIEKDKVKDQQTNNHERLDGAELAPEAALLIRGVFVWGPKVPPVQQSGQKK